MNRKIIRACINNAFGSTDVYELECGHIFFQPRRATFTNIVWCSQCDRAKCVIPNTLSEIWPSLPTDWMRNGISN